MAKQTLVIKKDSIVDNGKIKSSVEIFDGKMLVQKAKVESIEPILEQVYASSTDNPFDKIKLQQTIEQTFKLFECIGVTVKER